MSSVRIAPIVLDVIRSNWDESAVPYDPSEVNGGDGTTFHTSWYSRHPDRPTVTFTGESGSVVDGGETGVSATGVGGIAVQKWQGSLDVNLVGGQFDDLLGVAPDGSDVSPKATRDDMFDELNDILRVAGHVDGVRTMNCTSFQDREDEGEGGDIYRTVARVRAGLMVPEFGERVNPR
jgi:hypothetical protein